MAAPKRKRKPHKKKRAAPRPHTPTKRRTPAKTAPKRTTQKASRTVKKVVRKPTKAPAKVPAKKVGGGGKAAPKATKATKGVVGWVTEFIQKPTTTPEERAAAKKSLERPKKVEKKVVKPTKTEKLAAEVKKLKAEKKQAEAKRKADEKRYEKTKAELAKTKAGAKRLKAQEERKKERSKKERAEKTPTEAETHTYKAKIGKTTHVSATEIDGEPQYIWKELEEKTEDMLVRTPKSKTRRWARLVVELSKESLLFPDQYRRLRGKAVIRTNWHPAHELVGKAAEVMDKLQKSGAVVPRAKIVIVESNKKPPKRVF